MDRKFRHRRSNTLGNTMDLVNAIRSKNDPKVRQRQLFERNIPLNKDIGCSLKCYVNSISDVTLAKLQYCGPCFLMHCFEVQKNRPWFKLYARHNSAHEFPPGTTNVYPCHKSGNTKTAAPRPTVS